MSSKAKKEEKENSQIEIADAAEKDSSAQKKGLNRKTKPWPSGGKCPSRLNLPPKNRKDWSRSCHLPRRRN
ncbi:MAG: hypothetical protein CM1200mP34_1810 [Verrucomicrobiales bacterium]|nr:MAG: hypothetical protein CM1200mP34_1810 [Verrucomicrobiales bacterium]